jgi:hypothetical protein
MANVGFWPLQARQKGIKEVHFKVTIGATGAPTLSADASLGVASISRTSAGLYVITLRDKYTALVNASFMHLDDALQDLSFQVNAETVASTKTITLWTRVVATATDPTDTAIIYGTLTLKNSSV